MDDNLEERAKRFKEQMGKHAEKLHPGGKMKTVKTSDIKDAPIRHESLPPKMLKTLGQLYDDVGRYVQPTLEQWELGFMRDTHPEREVRVWCGIAMAWHIFHKRHTGYERLRDEEEKKLVSALSMISCGTTDVKELRLPESTGRRLLECYLDAKKDQ